MSKPELPATTAEVSKLRQMSWPQLVEGFAQLPCRTCSKCRSNSEMNYCSWAIPRIGC